MEHEYAQLTIFFEDPFWVGLYERGSGGIYEVCRIVFGPEPRDCEVYDLLLKSWHALRFSPPMAGTGQRDRSPNPKRQQREIKRTLQTAGVGTKAQQALKLQQAQGKEARKRHSREEREADAARRLALHREKQREKHKGHRVGSPGGHVLRGLFLFWGGLKKNAGRRRCTDIEYSKEVLR